MKTQWLFQVHVVAKKFMFQYVGLTSEGMQWRAQQKLEHISFCDY
jgi:hypothetical protein